MATYADNYLMDSGGGVKYVTVVDCHNYCFWQTTKATWKQYPYTFNVKKGDMLATPYCGLNGSYPTYNRGSGVLHGNAYISDDDLAANTEGSTATFMLIRQPNNVESWPLVSGLPSIVPYELKTSAETYSYPFGNVIVATSDGTIVLTSFERLCSVFQLRLSDVKQNFVSGSKTIQSGGSITFSNRAIIAFSPSNLSYTHIGTSDGSPINFTAGYDLSNYRLPYPGIVKNSQYMFFGISAGTVVSYSSTGSLTVIEYTWT